ncbi:hypothetical protein GPA07_13570 [Bacillus sp. ms-22]|nr:hypothetical protein GPA07_13570 [Bacillus sp. ms-22]
MSTEEAYLLPIFTLGKFKKKKEKNILPVAIQSTSCCL